MTHFISLADFSTDQIQNILELGHKLRDERNAGQPNEPVLAGQTLLMYFAKPSLRTRVSFEQAMYELGGQAIVIGQNEVGLGKRESVPDFTRVINGMAHGIMARVFEHDMLVQMTEHATIPVINALSDYNHPCQALADIMTMQDEFGNDLADRGLVFVGDGNNVARSLATICAKLGMKFTLACPEGYELESDFYPSLKKQMPDAQLKTSHDPAAAVEQTDAIYCDTFVSMGQEEEKQKRLKDFAEFQINEELLAKAPAEAIVLHCLPAYRGVEITDGVMDGESSRVFPQAHNRLHAQKGLLAMLMGRKSV